MQVEQLTTTGFVAVKKEPEDECFAIGFCGKAVTNYEFKTIEECEEAVKPFNHIFINVVGSLFEVFNSKNKED